jgi:hypothetical protein
MISFVFIVYKYFRINAIYNYELIQFYKDTFIHSTSAQIFYFNNLYKKKVYIYMYMYIFYILKYYIKKYIKNLLRFLLL